LTPSNAPALFRQWEVPYNFAFLKIDIDSDDCELLEAILAHYSPMVVTLEVFEEFIPPIDMSMSYPGSPRRDVYPVLPMGCSATYVHRLLSPKYRLLQYDMVYTSHDLSYIRRDLHLPKDVGEEPSVLEAFVTGYMEHQRRITHTAEPRPFPEGKWRNGVDMEALIRAASDPPRLRSLVAQMKRGTLRELRRTWGVRSWHLNFTMNVADEAWASQPLGRNAWSA